MKINHILVIARDIDAMKDFWINIIGLSLGERPAFPFSGYWFYSKGRALVHLVENKHAVYANNSIAHVAFDGADYRALLNRLQQFEQRYTVKNVPLTGDRQVFISGPDSITVEMLFPVKKESKAFDNKPVNSDETYVQNENLDYLGSSREGNIK